MLNENKLAADLETAFLRQASSTTDPAQSAKQLATDLAAAFMAQFRAAQTVHQPGTIAITGAPAGSNPAPVLGSLQ